MSLRDAAAVGDVPEVRALLACGYCDGGGKATFLSSIFQSSKACSACQGVGTAHVEKLRPQVDWALQAAAVNGHADVASLLLVARVAVNMVGPNGCSALHPAAFQGNESIAAMLIEARANINVRALERDTPLMQASIRGHQGVVSLMLRAGADVEAEDIFQRTAMLYAAAQGHSDCVRLLLQGAANTESSDRTGNTALLLAVARHHQGVTDLLQNSTLILTLHFSPSDSEGWLNVSCTSMQGEELAVCEVRSADEIGRIKGMLARELGVLGFKALLPWGQVLGPKDDSSPISAFACFQDTVVDEHLV